MGEKIFLFQKTRVIQLSKKQLYKYRVCKLALNMLLTAVSAYSLAV